MKKTTKKTIAGTGGANTAARRVTHMKKKTTLMIEEDLFVAIRQRAAAQGVSSSSIVCEAVRKYCAAPKDNPFLNLPRSEGDWFGPSISEISNAELYAMMDEDLPLEKRR